MLDLKKVASKLITELKLEETYDFPCKNLDGTGMPHAYWLLHELSTGNVDGEKGNKWLGYAQCLLISYGVSTLEEMKLINENSISA